MKFFGRGKQPKQLFTFDGEPKLEATKCHHCDEAHHASNGLVLSNGSAFAAYWANWYPHEGEAWVDMAMGAGPSPTIPTMSHSAVESVSLGTHLRRNAHSCRRQSSVAIQNCSA